MTRGGGRGVAASETGTPIEDSQSGLQITIGFCTFHFTSAIGVSIFGHGFHDVSCKTSTFTRAGSECYNCSKQFLTNVWCKITTSAIPNLSSASPETTKIQLKSVSKRSDTAQGLRNQLIAPQTGLPAGFCSKWQLDQVQRRRGAAEPPQHAPPIATAAKGATARSRLLRWYRAVRAGLPQTQDCGC